MTTFEEKQGSFSASSTPKGTSKGNKRVVYQAKRRKDNSTTYKQISISASNCNPNKKNKNINNKNYKRTLIQRSCGKNIRLAQVLANCSTFKIAHQSTVYVRSTNQTPKTQSIVNRNKSTSNDVINASKVSNETANDMNDNKSKNSIHSYFGGEFPCAININEQMNELVKGMSEAKITSCVSNKEEWVLVHQQYSRMNAHQKIQEYQIGFSFKTLLILDLKLSGILTEDEKKSNFCEVFEQEIKSYVVDHKLDGYRTEQWNNAIFLYKPYEYWKLIDDNHRQGTKQLLISNMFKKAQKQARK